VFVGLEEGDIEVLDFDLQKIFRLTGHLDAVWCIDVLEDLMVSGSYDGSIKL
jgi:WD domain, G-beta repeat.